MSDGAVRGVEHCECWAELEWVDCDTCDGSGWVVDGWMEVMCEECDGHGGWVGCPECGERYDE